MKLYLGGKKMSFSSNYFNIKKSGNNEANPTFWFTTHFSLTDAHNY